MDEGKYRVLREAARVDPEWAVIEAVWNAYAPDDRLDALSPGQRAVYALQWIRTEVTNGGFHQCFWNPAGYLLPEAVDGARLLESAEWWDLLHDAAGTFPSPYPRNRAERQALLGTLPEESLGQLYHLDDRLFDLDGEPATSLDGLIRRYVEGHPEEFFVAAASEEEACRALLEGARGLVNEPPPRRLGLAGDLLREAAQRSRRDGTGQVALLAESLLAQLPDLLG